MQRLKQIKPHWIKYIFSLIVNGVLLLILGVDSTVLKRIIIDLMLKGLSLNQIQEHL